MLEYSSSSSFNLRAAILHFQFSFRLHLDRFTIRWISRKFHCTKTSEVWLTCSRFCALGLPQGTNGPFTSPVDLQGLTKGSATRGCKLIHFTATASITSKHHSLFVMMIKIICDGLVLILYNNYHCILPLYTAKRSYK